MEDTMMDLMYEIPGSDNTTKRNARNTKDAVEKKAEPEIIHGEPALFHGGIWEEDPKTGNRLKKRRRKLKWKK